MHSARARPKVDAGEGDLQAREFDMNSKSGKTVAILLVARMPGSSWGKMRLA